MLVDIERKIDPKLRRSDTQKNIAPTELNVGLAFFLPTSHSSGAKTRSVSDVYNSPLSFTRK